MAKDRKKLQHMHSSIPDKQPTPASLEVGEIAVNNAAEQEFLSVKNTNNKVVRFSSDGQIIEWIERKEVMPYKGYVRGDGGPAVTSGDSPTSDEKGSYGISNDDLLNNKSQLVFKLNQVAADLTTKHDKVNGAKDMYNKDVNPTDDYGVNDGAGFFIDMSRYAMIDANPSFSALTATCQTRLSGNTYISDGASANTYGTDTGHTLDIKVTDTVASGVTWGETLSAKTEDISGRTTVIGNDGEKLTVSGTTTETKKGVVTETNLSAKTENTSGTSTTNIVENNIVNVSGETHITTTGNTAIHTDSKLGLTAVDDILESSEASITITANEDVCETAGNQASFYGVAQTNLGLDCVDSTPSVVTNLYGDTINTDADTANTTIGTAITQINSAKTNISTATTVIGTADTKITSATTLIGTNTITVSGNTIENHSGTTTETKKGIVTENNLSAKTENTTGDHNINVSGETCIISQKGANLYGKIATNIGIACDGDKSSMTNVVGKNLLYMSGATTTLEANSTTITSCQDITINTNDLKIKQCSNNRGTAEFDFCGGYNVNSDNVEISQCTDGMFTVNERYVDINAEDTVINNSGNTSVYTENFGVASKLGTTISTSGSTTIESKIGDTSINTTGDTIITSTDNICITADGDAAFVGTDKTNIGKNCSDGGQTSILNINGNTINETGNTVNISAATNVNVSADTICESAKTEADFYAPKTQIGISCGGSTATTVNVSGTTINEGGTTNNNTFTTINDTTTNYNINTTDYDLNGANICVSGSTKTDIYGKETNIGVDCGGTTATTVNISGTTINEGGTNLNQNVTNYDLNGSVICVSGSTNSNFYGKETNIGVDCGGTTATTVNVSGTTINEGGTTNNNTFTTVNNTATTINNSTTDYNINTTNYDLNGSVICVSGSTNTDVYGKTTNIGVDCGGTTATTVNISGTTINEGGTNLNQNVTNYDLNGSVICISGSTNTDVYGKTTNIGVDCGGTTATTVNVSGTTINEGGTTNNNTFTTVNNTATTINNSTTDYNINTTNYDLNGATICVSGSSVADFYGKTTNVGVDCGGTTATTVNVSGTTINEGGTTNNNTFTTVNNTATTINNNTTNYNITGTTNISGNTTIDGTLNVSGVTTIGDTLIIKKGLEKTLSWEYGSVCNEPTSATSTNFKDDAKFIIPKTLSDVSCGVVDLTDGCLNINKNICVTGKIEVSNGVFNTSDRRLKENIKRVGFEKMLAAHNVSIQQFNYLNDGDKRLTYGVIAQEVQERNIPEVIYLNEEGYMSVDYTSLMILKIAYLENEVERLTNKLGQVLEKLDNK